MPVSTCLHVLWLLVSTVGIKDVCGVEDQVVDVSNGPVELVAGLADGPEKQVAGVVDDPAEQVAGLVDDPAEQEGSLVDGLVQQVASLVDGHGDLVAGLVDSFMDQVAVVVSQVVEQHLTSCQLVLATTTDNTSEFSYILRFLEWSELWLWPETSVVVVGTRTGMESVLLHSSLRNTVHLLYLALEILPRQKLPVNTWLRKEPYSKCRYEIYIPTLEGSARVEIYRRCLYCNRGEMGVHSVQQLNLSSRLHLEHNLFPDRPENFMGHTLKIVALPYFPYIAYEKNSEDPDGPVSPRDALNTRMMDVIAAQLNLTYEIREPLDGNWGVQLANGSWTGIVGTLQHQQADLSLDLTETASRLEVISFTRVYTHDPMVIVSLKPGRLPRHLALIRPFTGELWVLIAACTLAFGVVLWLLQMVWSSLSGERNPRLTSTIFYSWGVLLDDPPTDPPANVSGRMLVGFWFLSCMVIGTAYRSSLIAHLAVQKHFLPINSFEDLLGRDGWSWGSYELLGTTFTYFNQSSDPIVQEINKRMMQVIDKEQGMERVLAGGFSYILHKKIFQFDLEHNDKYSNTPLHLGSTEYPIFGGNAWGVRRGAPFTGQISAMKQRMMEAGLITYWEDDVLRERFISTKGASKTVSSEGAFYLLLLGYIIAFFSLLKENLARSCPVLHRQQSQLLQDSFS
ncbi:glutamate receptor ionotropic, kainate 4-like [Panulirus ornatus]|uniref:glutamate receptor ionotropic, kainate 4-like n=1 Tax=Panulirus ornatus TaxID=150431 RepID=UPI003A8B8209